MSFEWDVLLLFWWPRNFVMWGKTVCGPICACTCGSVTIWFHAFFICNSPMLLLYAMCAHSDEKCKRRRLIWTCQMPAYSNKIKFWIRYYYNATRIVYYPSFGQKMCERERERESGTQTFLVVFFSVVCLLTLNQTEYWVLWMKSRGALINSWGNLLVLSIVWFGIKYIFKKKHTSPTYFPSLGLDLIENLFSTSFFGSDYVHLRRVIGTICNA